MIIGTNFNIEKLSKRYDVFKNSAKFGQFYKACKGDLKSLKPILDGLRLSQHKNIIVEFCNLLQNNDKDLYEIPRRLGLIPEHFVLFSNLFSLMICCSKYAIIGPNKSGKILKDKREVYKNAIISKLTDMHLTMTKGNIFTN